MRKKCFRNGNWSFWWLGGFLRIFTVAFNRLFYVRLGKGEWLPRRVRNRRKAKWKETSHATKPTRSQKCLDAVESIVCNSETILTRSYILKDSWVTNLQSDTLTLSHSHSICLSLSLFISLYLSFVYLVNFLFLCPSLPLMYFATSLSFIFLNVCLWCQAYQFKQSRYYWTYSFLFIMSKFLCRKKQGEENIKCLNKESGQSKPKFLGKEIGNFVVAQLLYNHSFIISIVRPTITYMVFYNL